MESILAKKKSNAKSRSFTDMNVIDLDERRPEKSVIRRTRKHEVEINPRNAAQVEFLTQLNNDNNKVVFAVGPAGTGKSLISTLFALRELQMGRVERIIITRPAVSVDEDLGFLPGDLNEKMAPWVRPIFDIFEEYFTPFEVKNMIKDGVIEIAPLAYIRGRTFKNSIMILDESQNCTVSQEKAILTRIGDGTRMIVTGDLNQSDFSKTNGLLDIINRLRTYRGSMISVCTFGREHVERSPIVGEILAVYGEE